jgi:hypothetical protein
MGQKNFASSSLWRTCEQLLDTCVDIDSDLGSRGGEATWNSARVQTGCGRTSSAST